MSKNINQIYIANPITSNASTDLMYFGQSPYGVGNDAAMTYANFSAQFGAPYTASALTSSNDTNVTITLGGTPNISLLHAVSLTMGWTGTLSGSRGGLGAAITASNGGIYYSTASNGALLSGTATANQVLLSGSSSAPAWSTATYPATTTINQILYSSSANTIAGISAANNGVLISGTTGIPSFLANSGTPGFVLTANAGAPPSWQATGTPTGAALTEVNDTNVTLTLGGTPATALLQATSITAGWAGTLAVSRGGTGAGTLTGLLTGNGTSAITGTAITQYNVITGGASNVPNSVAPTSTSGVPLISQGSASQPIFGTAVVAGGGTGATTFNTNGVVISNTTTTGALASLSLTDGQVVIGSSAGAPLAASITAGTGISVTPGHNTITIASTVTGGFTWNDVSGTTQTAAGNNGYIISNAAQTTVTIPATIAEGQVIGVAGKGAAGWILQANTGQTIHYGSSATSSAGSLTSTNQWDSVQILCVTANTTFSVIASQGNLTPA